MNFKLRIYKKKGSFKGDLDHEEFFKTHKQMEDRYNELFVYEDYALNPTAWELINEEWIRLEGF